MFSCSSGTCLEFWLVGSLTWVSKSCNLKKGNLCIIFEEIHWFISHCLIPLYPCVDTTLWWLSLIQSGQQIANLWVRAQNRNLHFCFLVVISWFGGGQLIFIRFIVCRTMSLFYLMCTLTHFDYTHFLFLCIKSVIKERI